MKDGVPLALYCSQHTLTLTSESRWSGGRRLEGEEGAGLRGRSEQRSARQSQMLELLPRSSVTIITQCGE